MVIAAEAALQHHPGVVAIAGTGSIAFGRNQDGETARAGGWGYAISDEGSGQWIGKTAVSEAMRSFDAQRRTFLLERILHGWQLPSRDDLVRYANSSPPPSFAELFPVVQKAATEHDVLASDILTRAGSELAQLVLTVIHRLWKPREAHSEQVRRSFYNSLRAAWPRAAVCFRIAEPVVGALGLARRMSSQAGAV
jgi:N-acetylglucosamine kinase-like BadF-type ATPase